MAESYNSDDVWNLVEDHLVRALQADKKLKAGGALAVKTWEKELPEDAGVYQQNLLPAVAVEVVAQTAEEEVGYPDRVRQRYQAVIAAVVTGGELGQVKERAKGLAARIIRTLQYQHHPACQLDNLPAAVEGAEAGSVVVSLLTAEVGGGRLASGGGLRGIAEITCEVGLDVITPGAES